MGAFAFRRHSQGVPALTQPAEKLTAEESFKPLPVLAPNTPLRRFIWRTRLLVDLQLASVYRHLRAAIPAQPGTILDVGCGDMPFRSLFPPDADYTGYDVQISASGFGYSNAKVRSFDGNNLPVEDASVGFIVCTEVLEHHPEPHRLIDEMHRVLKPAGTLFVTMPWSARLHFKPHDYRRCTPYELERMFAKFSGCNITPRGTDVAVISNKLIVVTMRCLQGAKRGRLGALLALPFLLPLVPVLVLLGQLGLRGWVGSPDDPLGYTVVASKADR